MINYSPIPVLLELGGMKIYSFGFMIVIAAIVFLVLSKKKISKIMDSEKIYSLAVWIIIFAVAGARIAYLIANSNEFSSFIEIIYLWRGGLSGVGVILGGIVGIYLFSKMQKVNFLELIDIIVPYLALSLAIGRIGCFLRGCCHGLPTNLPWGILYGENSLATNAGLNVPVHPTQMYMALYNLIIFFILLEVYKKKKEIRGFTLLVFLSLFSLQRILVDFIRYYPESNYVGSFTIFQIVYSVIFIISVLFLIFTIHQGKNRRKL